MEKFLKFKSTRCREREREREREKEGERVREIREQPAVLSGISYFVTICERDSLSFIPLDGELLLSLSDAVRDRWH